MEKDDVDYGTEKFILKKRHTIAPAARFKDLCLISNAIFRLLSQIDKTNLSYSFYRIDIYLHTTI